MTEAQLNSLFNLYSEYNEEIAPLIAEIELRYENFPVAILNEVRSFTTHISRCTLSNEYRYDSELEKASRHILRMKLDCYKYLCFSLQLKQDLDFSKKFLNVDLSNVNNGEFVLQYRDLLQSAFLITLRAKLLEKDDPENALPQYIDALNKYRSVEELENQNYALLVDAKRKYIKDKYIANPLISIAIGVVSYILTCFADFAFREKIIILFHRFFN